MRLWLVPMVYVFGATILGFGLPRLEHELLASYTHGLSVASTQSFLSAVASGMMALTGIVFAIAIVIVQFSAIAYSPRLALLFTKDRTLFHALWRVCRHVHLCAFDSRVDRSRRVRNCAVSFKYCGAHIAHYEHVAVFIFGAAPERSSDHECVADDRSSWPRGHSTHAQATRR